MASGESSQLKHNADPCRLIPCANNCGFFGSPDTNNLCSFCYRQALRASTVRVSQTENPTAPLHSSSSSASGPQVCNSDAKGSSFNPNRCGFCHKRVGLVPFKCRCGGVFCSVHRYSDKHECSFDYKAAARQAIAEANPVVKASKLCNRI